MEVFTYGNPEASAILIQMVGGHDLAVIENEVREIRKRTPIDFRLVNLVQKGDIAITQDYGLAAMCLSKGAIVLHQDGKQYTEENISGLLEFRAVSKKIRRSGGRLKGNPKRTAEQDTAFETALRRLLAQQTNASK